MARAIWPARRTPSSTRISGSWASFGRFRAGLTLRNVTEPDFDTPGGGALELKRQTRAGLAYFGVQRIIVAADIDVERVQGSLGEVRNFAAGVEARILPRAPRSAAAFVSTPSPIEPGGHAPVYTIGGSFAAFRSMFVDGQVTVGSDAGDRGWGIAARLVY